MLGKCGKTTGLQSDTLGFCNWCKAEMGLPAEEDGEKVEGWRGFEIRDCLGNRL